MKLLDYELKPLTMKQLSDCEDMMEAGKPVMLHDVMKWCCSPKGVAAALIIAGLPKDNLDEVLEKCTFADIEYAVMGLCGWLDDEKK